MADPTLDLLINKEQYDFLASESAGLNMLIATDNLKNFDTGFLRGCNALSMLIYNHQPHNINCATCIKAMMKPLAYQMNLYAQR